MSKKKIKVMHLIHGLSIGGAETLVKDYCLNLDKNKFEVFVLCYARYDSAYEKIIEKMGIKFICVQDEMIKRIGVSAVDRFICKIEKYRLIKKYIHEIEPDVIHSHLPLNEYVKYARPKSTTGIIHTVHSEPQIIWFDERKKSEYTLKYIRWRIARTRDFKAAKWLADKYDMRFIALHDDMRREVNKLFGINNTIVLNNGIDFERFDRRKYKTPIRETLGILEDAFVIGNVGRLDKPKNHIFLLNVFAEIKKIRQNSFLVLVGSGSELSSIENEIKRLKIEGSVKILSNRTDIPELLMAMDVFVFPSIYEGLGIVLIEAQKMEVPCVISNTIPKQVVVSNFVTTKGLEESYSSWAEEVLKQGNRIKDDIEYYDINHWDMKEVVRKLEQVYINLVEERKKL